MAPHDKTSHQARCLSGTTLLMTPGQELIVPAAMLAWVRYKKEDHRDEASVGLEITSKGDTDLTVVVSECLLSKGGILLFIELWRRDKLGTLPSHGYMSSRASLQGDLVVFPPEGQCLSSPGPLGVKNDPCFYHTPSLQTYNDIISMRSRCSLGTH